MSEEKLPGAFNALGNDAQVAFLAGCIEHVGLACETNETIRGAIESAWAFALGGKHDPGAITEIRAALDETVDEDSATDLLHLASAAELVIEGIDAVSEVAVKVLNNVEAAIEVVDPNPELGIAEELVWQQQALDLLSRLNGEPPFRAIFARLSVVEVAWMDRVG